MDLIINALPFPVHPLLKTSELAKNGGSAILPFWPFWRFSGIVITRGQPRSRRIFNDVHYHVCALRARHTG
jgi:hypothetical protein